MGNARDAGHQVVLCLNIKKPKLSFFKKSKRPDMKKNSVVLLAAGAAVLSMISLGPKATDITDFTMPGEKVVLADEPAKWSMDKKHSNVTFNASYMSMTQVGGRFTSFDGTIENTKADFSDAKIEFTIDANSITTDDAGRDGHLKKDDFFNTELYPTIKFTSTSFKPKGNNMYELIGDLTVRDVTRPATFEMKYGGSVKDARGGVRAGFRGRAVIDRFAYGVKWDSKTAEGSFVVDKDVEVVVNIQLRQAGEKK